MRNIFVCVLITGLLGSVSTGGAVSAHPAPLGEATLASFSNRVWNDAGRSLSESAALGGSPSRSGTATIAFRANPDGTSRLVTLTRSSGNAGLDRQAMRAVRRLSSLSPMPGTLDSEQRFSMTVLFAKNTGSYPLERKRQLANANLKNRWFTDTEGNAVGPIRAR